MLFAAVTFDEPFFALLSFGRTQVDDFGNCFNCSLGDVLFFNIDTAEDIVFETLPELFFVSFALTVSAGGETAVVF